jgi:hypothetical protein
MVLIPLKQSQQSKGAKPDPSAFCRNAISLAKLSAIKRSIMPANQNHPNWWETFYEIQRALVAALN